MALHARLQKLQEAWKALGFTSWRDVHDDTRCCDAAEWLVRSVWAPTSPNAVPLTYTPNAPGSEILDALCKRFGV